MTKLNSVIKSADIALDAENKIVVEIAFKTEYGLFTWSDDLYNQRVVHRLKDFLHFLGVKKLSDLVGRRVEIVISEDNSLWGFVKCDSNDLPIRNIPFYNSLITQEEIRRKYHKKNQN